LIPLVVLTTIFTVGTLVRRVHNLGAPGAAEFALDVEFRPVLAWWVRVDRRVRGFSVPFEFDAFVFFAMPFIVPVLFVPDPW